MIAEQYRPSVSQVIVQSACSAPTSLRWAPSGLRSAHPGKPLGRDSWQLPLSPSRRAPRHEPILLAKARGAPSGACARAAGGNDPHGFRP